LLSARCIEEIGGFDPLFPHYSEDSDYINRVLYRGFKIGIVPNTRIFHDRHQKLHSYNKVSLQNTAILKYKNPNMLLPTNSFLLRELIIKIITSYFLYRGRNMAIKSKIAAIKIGLKYRSRIKKHRDLQKNTKSPYIT
jgi:GT2 family glycosyltransferase